MQPLPHQNRRVYVAPCKVDRLQRCGELDIDFRMPVVEFSPTGHEPTQSEGGIAGNGDGPLRILALCPLGRRRNFFKRCTDRMQVAASQRRERHLLVAAAEKGCAERFFQRLNLTAHSTWGYVQFIGSVNETHVTSRTFKGSKRI